MKSRVAVQPSQGQLSMFILDVLQHDACEQVPSIVRMLNDASGSIGWREYWPHDFSDDEVLTALEELRDADLIRLWKETADGALGEVDAAGADIRKDHEHLWFGLSPKGKQEWEQWQPPSALTN